MKSDLRKNPQRSMGRYWLAMSDASAFTLVRSAIAIAHTLRRDMADQARIVPILSAPEIAVQLLTAAEAAWGKGKGTHLMAQLASLRGHDCVCRARAWMVLRDAVTSLPMVLWPPEKLAARRELLDDLERQVNAARAETAPLPSKLEIREQQWRDSVTGRGPHSAHPGESTWKN
ncbi:hypothetical protein [Pseudoduganella chitinolytica]|uniref:Uncharacterized protein n=1 Tax=Pseudoduganella chitinolytica TaxID=34070 RepID=A0ABY8BB41_9BURK|nr:hypothetical protein [Pseudoduganella chitinolytica]WEF32218.1 hypothetical protein PX653_22800 [Pseudoduganella chitinolytica]